METDAVLNRALRGLPEGFASCSSGHTMLDGDRVPIIVASAERMVELGSMLDDDRGKAVAAV
jgi:hypothetical protein